ncbi:MAG TPA: hypothetical protein PKH24_00340 [Sedimentisphaerales bacterium]|jgi:hypothetical protein|nr:hypothetical protein [Sedimentisphaerales bacterium]HNU27659.1 hypothetical protein [Sedimentisphaerales bacterium]
MFKKTTCLVPLVLLLVQVHSASALISWDDGGGDHLWSTAANWNPNTVPGRMDAASIDQPANTHCVIQDGIAAECETLRVGNGSVTTNLDITGGSLWAAGAYIGVDNPSGHGILNLSGGKFATGSLQIGLEGTGTLNMTGGVIELTDNLVVPGGAGAGTVNLRGGTIRASDLYLTSDSGSIDITAGKLILDGDDTEAVQAWIDSGRITAYKRQGRLNLNYDVTNEGRTTLTATAFLDPRPVDGGLVSPGEVTLSWTLPDPCVPGEPVLADVYFTDKLELLEQFTDPAAIRIVNKQNVTSVVVQTQVKKRYYWAVDTYVGSPNDPVFGPIFSFYVDNRPPQVDAGADVVTWLEGGPRAGTLAATITDDGLVSACTLQWTVVSEPNEGSAVIGAPTAADTSVTLAAVGQYVFQAQAFDGEYSGSDTVTINVYSDKSQATRSVPGYVPLVGDLNGDCRVDDLDLAMLQENWLKDNSLTDTWHLLD